MISNIEDGVVQLSSAYQPLAATATNPGVVPPSVVSTGATLGGFAVLVAPTVNAFFPRFPQPVVWIIDDRRQNSPRQTYPNPPTRQPSQAR